MKKLLFYCLSLIFILAASSCNKDVVGCMDPTATNYDPEANVEGSCNIVGCTNPKADNYNPKATVDNEQCIIKGCTNPKASNYDAEANVDNGSCIIKGCTNPKAYNYDAQATQDDGSCKIKGCKDNQAVNYDAEANEDDGSCKYPKDIFIGSYAGKIECDNQLVQNAIAGQDFEIIISEIAGENKKVNLALGFNITGFMNPTGDINGRELTYNSPEQTVSILIAGTPTDVKITNDGKLILANDDKTLSGNINIKAVVGLFPLETVCAVTGIKK